MHLSLVRPTVLALVLSLNPGFARDAAEEIIPGRMVFTPVGEAKCEIIDPPSCDLLDVTLVRHEIEGPLLAQGISQVCGAAIGRSSLLDPSTVLSHSGTSPNTSPRSSSGCSWRVPARSRPAGHSRQSKRTVGSHRRIGHGVGDARGPQGYYSMQCDGSERPYPTVSTTLRQQRETRGEPA